MKLLGEDMTIVNFNSHVEELEEKRRDKSKNRSFIEFIQDEITHEDVREGTLRHKLHVLETLKVYGKIRTIGDLTPANIRAFDRWLHDTGDRTDVTVWGYHKRIRKYTRMLKLNEIIEQDPYELCKIPHGRSKVREPLTEDELLKLRRIKLNPTLARVRDLFIFAAYTGLSYIDVQEFNFQTMTHEIRSMHYIETKRVKTGVKFFTPILKPAMLVLEKYSYKLPRISNQKANAYLHVIEQMAGIEKSLTFHLARHSFATLALSHDVPIEDVAKMLGHTNIRTTQIYAKCLNTTVERHAESMSRTIL